MKYGLGHQLSSLRKMFSEDKWMSGFYGKKWIKIDSPEDSDLVTEKDCLLECVVESSEVEKMKSLWDMGFSLVETAIEFQTLIFPKERTPFPSDFRPATREDLPEVIKITKECYSRKTKFKNRFSDRNFFSEEQEESYFESAVTNYLLNKNCISIISESNGRIEGYYTAQYVGESRDGTRIYKGILTAVSRRSRGKNLHTRMQDEMARIIGNPYFIINRTQLNNYRVINNHIKEGRNLTKAEHYFYLLKT